MLKTEVDRRVRMCNLQSAKDCASVKTSLATVHARAQEMGIKNVPLSLYKGNREGAHGPFTIGGKSVAREVDD